MNWYLHCIKNYANFSGRARRKEYWMFFLVNFIINVSLSVITEFSGIAEFVWVENIYSYAVLVPSLAVGVRRMHDTGRSGWYYIIPLYNLYVATIDGEMQSNKWGDNPKGIGNNSEINLIGKE